MDPEQCDATAQALPTASLSVLSARANVVRTIRSFFEKHGYSEVETPLLSRDVCVDAWLNPFQVASSSSGPLYLQTSPEFHMKRLLTAGAQRIYQITRSFRAGERGARHNHEFTILEWYAVGETYSQQMDLVEDLIRTVGLASSGGEQERTQNNASGLTGAPFQRVSYDEAFASATGRRVLTLSTAELRRLAGEHRIAVPRSLREDDRDGWLNLLMSAVVEPDLARRGAVFVYDYPATQAALARVRDESPPVAERFELYLNGVEICNGYQELTDADELDRRMVCQSAIRRKAGLPALPHRNRLSDAMRTRGLPECAGVALGVDRLVMWRLGAERVDDVVAFPADRA